MFTESLQIDVARQSSALRQDMAEVRRRPHVSNRRVVGIALALKRRSEAIEVQPTRPAAQMAQHLRCREVVSNMIVPACDRPTVAEPTGAQRLHVVESGSDAIHKKT
jgi:hypothetical protein